MEPTTVEFRYDASGGRHLSSTFHISKSAARLWDQVRMSGVSMLSRMSIVKHVECVDENQYDVSFCVSRTLGFVVSARLRIEFAEETRTVTICTEACTWGEFHASVCISELETGDCKVAYESTFRGIRLGKWLINLLPFVDAKLHAFTEHVVNSMKASVLQSHWRREFLETFDELVVKPLLTAPDIADRAMRCTDLHQHVERMLHRTVLGGKAYRALLVRLTAESLHGQLDAFQLRGAHVLGWIGELFQSCALVADDMMDDSETRRGVPCWYHEVGRACAINDSLLLYSCTYRLLAQYFSNDVVQRDKLARTLYDMAIQTCLGQALDTFSEGNMALVSQERYDAIVFHKTTYYTIINPLRMGVILLNLPDTEERELLSSVDALAVPLGQLFQEQDDYLDVFGDPKVSGKIGTDMRDGKCTWLLNFARTHPDLTYVQMATLDANYGARDKCDESAVRSVFVDLGAEQEYERRQRTLSEECMTLAGSRMRPVAAAVVSQLLRRTA